MKNKKKRILLTTLALLAIALLLPPSVWGNTNAPYAHTSGQTKSFVVVVSREGFNATGSPMEGSTMEHSMKETEPLVLNLVQGDAVHITFLYGDGDLEDDNPHVIFIEGIDLRTSVISRSNPSVTLDFVADKTGTFPFYCIVECEGMLSLESGRVLVEPHPSGPLPTTIDIMVHGAAVEGELTDIMATLTQDSQPVPGARLDFYVNTTFGLMKAGTAATDESGTASTSYRFRQSGNQAIIVEFTGTDSWATSVKELNVSVEPRVEGSVSVSLFPGTSFESLSRPPYVRGQNQMPDIRLVGVPFSQSLPMITLILLIIGSVWVTYGYVFAQIRAIKSESPPEGTKRDEGRIRSPRAGHGFNRAMLVGVVLIALIVVGAFANYQFGPAPQGKTETIRIDIKMVMDGDHERHVFDPSAITVHRGDHIVLIITNTDDDAEHGVVIPELNLNTGPLGPEKQATLEFDVNQTDTLTILCPVFRCVPDHVTMIGHLIVVA